MYIINLRYSGQCEATNSTVGSITYAPENDMPDLFLEWNQQDPVSELEITRNNIIYSYQGNRNPFIDNPFLATLIWGGPETDDIWAVLSDSYLHENSIRILPSLTNNLIKLQGIKENKFKVLIINQLGQTVIEIENESSIDVSNLNVGVYYLKLFLFKYYSPM